MERTTERRRARKRRRRRSETDREKGEGMCAKNNDRPIQRLCITGTRITGLNQFATHIHTVRCQSCSPPPPHPTTSTLLTYTHTRTDAHTHTRIQTVIHPLSSDPTSRRDNCELRGCEDLRFQADTERTEGAMVLTNRKIA